MNGLCVPDFIDGREARTARAGKIETNGILCSLRVIGVDFFFLIFLVGKLISIAAASNKLTISAASEVQYALHSH